MNAWCWQGWRDTQVQGKLNFSSRWSRRAQGRVRIHLSDNTSWRVIAIVWVFPSWRVQGRSISHRKIWVLRGFVDPSSAIPHTAGTLWDGNSWNCQQFRSKPPKNWQSALRVQSPSPYLWTLQSSLSSMPQVCQFPGPVFPSWVSGQIRVPRITCRSPPWLLWTCIVSR